MTLKSMSRKLLPSCREFFLCILPELPSINEGIDCRQTSNETRGTCAILDPPTLRHSGPAYKYASQILQSPSTSSMMLRCCAPSSSLLIPHELGNPTSLVQRTQHPSPEVYQFHSPNYHVSHGTVASYEASPRIVCKTCIWTQTHVLALSQECHRTWSGTGTQG